MQLPLYAPGPHWLFNAFQRHIATVHELELLACDG